LKFFGEESFIAGNIGKLGVKKEKKRNQVEKQIGTENNLTH